MRDVDANRLSLADARRQIADKLRDLAADPADGRERREATTRPGAEAASPLPSRAPGLGIAAGDAPPPLRAPTRAPKVAIYPLPLSDKRRQLRNESIPIGAD